MCGIFGLINYMPEIHKKDVLEKMILKGKRRGPEHSTINYIQNNIVFGFHRLAINGLNKKSNQPIILNHNNEKMYLICNGEIYNHSELSKKLNIQLTTNSDCEIIIHLYKKFGIERAVRMLDGVFSFILYDASINYIYISRDPYGIRPLYRVTFQHLYYKHKSFTSISSEIKTLRDYMFGLNDIVSNYNIQYETILPGSLNVYRQSYDEYSNVYWKYEWNVKYHITGNICHNLQLSNLSIYNQYNYYKSRIYNSLYEAVKKRILNTERTIGCLLSGGLDSSIIASLVCKISREINPEKKIQTFAIGFEESEDLKYAQKVADFIQSEHTNIICTENDFLSVIPEVIYSIESYDTTTVRASVGNYLVAKYIKENTDIKVVFNGDGSDELCGGYLYMHYAENDIIYDNEIRRLLKNIHSFDVLRSDKSISSNGLEARTPFLDKSFVEEYLSIPSELRYIGLKKCLENKEYNNLLNILEYNGQACEKWLLRSAIHDKNILPPDIVWRKKEAFSDGVSGKSKSWFSIITEYLKTYDGEIKLPYMDYIDENMNIITDTYSVLISKLKSSIKIFKKYNNDNDNDNDMYINIKDIRNIYNILTPDQISMLSLNFNIPTTLEQFYYRFLFELYFGCRPLHTIPYFWMPSFIKASDASARTLEIY